MIARRLLPGAAVVAVAGLMLAWSPLLQQAAQAPAAAQDAFDDIPRRDLLGYGVGWYLGEEVRNGLELDDVDANIDLLIEGFADGLVGDRPDVDQKRFDQLLKKVHVEMQSRMVERLLETDQEFKEIYDRNLARSKAYHEAHANDQGTITLPSGVQYTVIEEGDGPVPKVTDTVVVTGKGQLIEGPLFADVENLEVDIWTSTEGGQQILTMMSVGSTWHVAIPPERAYGAGGGPPNIGPNETLLFRITLVAIKEDGE